MNNCEINQFIAFKLFIHFMKFFKHIFIPNLVENFVVMATIQIVWSFHVQNMSYSRLFFRSKNKFNDEGELEQQIDMFR